MSKKTIFTCDKCGHEQDTDNQFWTVSVGFVYGTGTVGFGNGAKSLQVCRPCLEGFGLVPQTDVKKTSEAKTPSVEDLIREILGHFVTAEALND